MTVTSVARGREIPRKTLHLTTSVVPLALWMGLSQRTAAAALQYTWSSGEWRSLEVNPLIAQVHLRTLQALARSEVSLPEFVVKRSGWKIVRESWQQKNEE